MRVTKYVQKQLTLEERSEAAADAKLILQSLDSLRESISAEVKKILESKKISFNALKDELGISSRTLSKLSKGEGNVTLETVALLSQINNKTPRLVWK